MPDIRYYCVGFNWSGHDNKLPFFVENGIWENGRSDRFLDIVKDVPIGSILAAKTTYTRNDAGKKVSVLEIHAFGRVLENPGDGSNLKVAWDMLKPHIIIDGKGAYRSTISQVRNSGNIALIFNSVLTPDQPPSEPIIQYEPEDKISLNTILYGPPGTGKTYATIEKAVSIIDGAFIYNLDPLFSKVERRNKIRERYFQLLKNKQIAFITFHQSLSYEDFIEGIKPFYDKKISQLIYPIKDGVFKEFCLNALKNLWLANENLKLDQQEEIDFEILYEGFIEKLKNNNELYPFTTKEGSKLRIGKGEIYQNYIVVYYEWSNSKTKISEGKTPFNIKKDVLERMFNGGITDNEVNLNLTLNPYLKYHKSPYYAVYKSLYQYIKSISGKISLIIDSENEKSEESIEPYSNEESDFEYYLERYQSTLINTDDMEPGDRFVLIIDEINRGNISGIFGELITLLEEDKRIGSSEGLTVKLPYSRQEFGVPPNLYIVGTMNTADRSVEALDTALRRRFSFESMPSKPSELSEISIENTGINLNEMLTAINERLSIFLDADRTIGHAWFMNVQTLEDLQVVFKNKILPLLSEFFYNDLGKVGLILGKQFLIIETVKKGNLLSFPEVSDLAAQYEDIYFFTINDASNLNAEDFIMIYDRKKA